jgi:hypothetical protein
MEIGLIYSKSDARQTKARDFLQRFVKERGVLAKIVEVEKDVVSPTVIIDGHALKDKRHKPRGERPAMYPSIKDIAEALERQLWCL